MTKFEIIHKLYTFSLRKSKYYTLTFVEDNIKFQYHKHDTGRHLNIYLVDDVSSLHVYYQTEWFSSGYLFNEEGKTQGYQVQGPWVEKIENKFKQFEGEIAKEEKRRELESEETQRINAEKSKDLINKFVEKFS